MMRFSDEWTPPVDEREGLILLFDVGGQGYGIRLTEVVRIDEENTDSCELRGRLDLREFFRREADKSGPSEKGVMIVLFDKEGNYGLLADEVIEIVPAQEAPELKWPPHIGGEAAEIFGGFFRRGETLFPALDPEGVKQCAAARVGC